MAINIVKKEDQAKGQFNGGEILENKPIGFPQDVGKQKPYSNLFYWAHAWTDVGSTIGEHPHQGFEIMSFVLEGSIEHYDNKHNAWKKLEAGDVQIIRAGNGITHAEKMNPGAHMFQIWFDPDLNKTLSKPATYSDYKSEQFEVQEDEEIKTKYYNGNNSPLEMDSEEVDIKEITFLKNNYELVNSDMKELSGYVVKGEMQLNGEQLKKGDFFRVTGKEKMPIKPQKGSKLFLIESPQRLSYKSYAELRFG